MSTLVQLYEQHQGKVSDKWSGYLPAYDAILSGYRDRPVRMLEIGVQNGGSLEIWSRYFPKAEQLVGCDINPDCGQLKFEDTRIQVVVGDAGSEDDAQRIRSLMGRIDIVLDDGSHRSSDIIKAFARFFPMLEDDGIFVAEDLHCSYWAAYEGGLHDPFSALAFFKHLVDVLNHEHWGIERARTALLQGIFERHGVQLSEGDLASIHSIEFINSICVVRKAAVDQNRLGRRVLAGEDAVVVPEVLSLRGTLSREVLGDAKVSWHEAENPWTARARAPAETIAETEQALADCQRELAKCEGILVETRLMLQRTERDLDFARADAANARDAIASLANHIEELRVAIASRDS